MENKQQYAIDYYLILSLLSWDLTSCRAPQDALYHVLLETSVGFWMGGFLFLKHNPVGSAFPLAFYSCELKPDPMVQHGRKQQRTNLLVIQIYN